MIGMILGDESTLECVARVALLPCGKLDEFGDDLSCEVTSFL